MQKKNETKIKMTEICLVTITASIKIDLNNNER